MILICHTIGHILFGNKLRQYRHEVLGTQLTLVLSIDSQHEKSYNYGHQVRAASREAHNNNNCPL